MKKILLGLVFLLLVSRPVSAHNRGLVLGEKTFLPSVPLAAGPGFLLPDSPFYFLDNFLDELKVFFTFTPVARANLRLRLAAEKLAELQILLARQSPPGLEVALSRLTANLEETGKILKKEAGKGKDVSGLAHDLNEGIDQQQEFLESLAELASPQERFLFKNAQARIAQAELEVEEKLGKEEFESELIEELTEGVKEETEEASVAAKRAAELNRELQEKLQEKLKERK